MSPETRTLLDFALSAIQCCVVVIGAAWAYLRFWREGVHRPRIEFDVACRAVGIEGNVRVVTIEVLVRNKGLVEHRFSRISLPIRGIKHGVTPDLREGGRVNFPDAILKAELVTEKIGYYFVRPGIEQCFTFTTTIHSDYRFILVRPAFQYQGSTDLHTCERVFALADNKPGSSD